MHLKPKWYIDDANATWCYLLQLRRAYNTHVLVRSGNDHEPRTALRFDSFFSLNLHARQTLVLCCCCCCCCCCRRRGRSSFYSSSGVSQIHLDHLYKFGPVNNFKNRSESVRCQGIRCLCWQYPSKPQRLGGFGKFSHQLRLIEDD